MLPSSGGERAGYCNVVKLVAATTFRTLLMLEYLKIMNAGHGVAWHCHEECAHAALEEVQGYG